MKIDTFFLFTMAFLFAVCMAGPSPAAENPNVHTYKIGEAEIILLSEGAGEREPSLFIGATPDQVTKYVPTGKYITATNTFLVRMPGRLVLVDTGFGRELFKNMEAVGVKPEQIDTVLLTHMHGDHIGGLLRDGRVAFPKAALYVAKPERDYWTNESIMKTFPEDRQGGFKNSIKTLAAYGDAVKTFEPGALDASGDDLLPGIRAIAAFGHTPGHTVYMVESKGSRMLIWGDLTHASAIQMPVPEVAMTYDTDPKMAVAARQAVMKYVAENNIPVAGMHVPLPGMGILTSVSGGGYTFSPVP